MLTLALVVFFLPIQEVILAEVTSTYFFYFFLFLSDTQISPSRPWAGSCSSVMKDFNLRFHPTEVELKRFWCLVEWKHDTFLVHLKFMLWILSLLLPSAYSIVWNIRWLFCQWKAVCLSRAVEQSVFSNIFSRQRRHPASSFVSCLFSDPSR